MSAETTMAAHAAELHDAALRLAGMLGLRFTMNIPPIESARIRVNYRGQGVVTLVVEHRDAVDQLAGALGVPGPPALDIYPTAGEHVYGVYRRADLHWQVECDERAPFEPVAGDDETADNTGSGS